MLFFSAWSPWKIGIVSWNIFENSFYFYSKKSLVLSCTLFVAKNINIKLSEFIS